jgi:hypothetical protein
MDLEVVEGVENDDKEEALDMGNSHEGLHDRHNSAREVLRRIRRQLGGSLSRAELPSAQGVRYSTVCNGPRRAETRLEPTPPRSNIIFCSRDGSFDLELSHR